MKQVKRWVMMAAVLCILAPQVRADEASKRTKVEELFAVLHLDERMDRIAAATVEQSSGLFKAVNSAQSMTPQQKQIVNEYEHRMLALVLNEAGWKAIKPEMVQLYASTFTEGEIDGIIAFCKSPTGQAFLQKAPELDKQKIQIEQAKITAIQPKLTEMTQEFAKQFAEASSPSPK